MEKNSLSERLGGPSVLEQVSHRIGEKLQKDPNYSHMFEKVDVKDVNQKRKDYLVALFGGQNNYKGKSLSEGHKHLNLKNSDFNMFVFYFKQILSEMKIEQNLIDEAVRLLESTRGEVLSEKTLFERLGGDELFNRLGEVLGKKILEDSQLGPIYSKTDFKRINEMRMQYFKSLFGGKGNYQGRSMREAHSKHQLDDSHFDRFIYLFKESLAELNVKEDLIREAMNYLETLRYQITNKRSLFDEIGGFETLDRIAANFQHKFKNEPTFSSFVMDVNEADKLKIRDGLKRYLAGVLGGPHGYNGKNLREAHSKLKITDQNFNLYFKLLRKAFLEEGVKEEIVNQFLEALDLTRDQVLNRKPILERLGGFDKLSAIVTEFHENLRKDKLLGPIYEKGDRYRMIRSYTQYFSYLFGEVEPHVDQSLGFIHGRFKLADVHFDLFIDMFARTLKNFKVNDELINEIQEQLEKRRNDVLQRKPLWERLGGEEFMNKACHRFEELLMKDPVVGPMHKNIDIQKYHENHMDLFADLFGGYHFYSGKSLKEAHRPLSLKDEHFDQFVKLFQQALKDSGVKQELLEEVREKMEFERNEVLNRRSLYEKMGGEQAIDLVVEKLHALIATDPDIGPFHKNVDWAKLQLHRKQFFIQLFGNLDVYQGKDLRTAHSEFKLSDKHFDKFLNLFKTALSQAGVSSDLTEQVLMLLEGTRREVLNYPSIFDKMGGKEGLMKFVIKLDDIVMKDPRLSKFFEKIDRNKMDEHQFQYFSNMFGGPKVSYEGKSVRSAHESLPLSDEHFKLYLEHTQEVLKDMNVDKTIVEDALSLFKNKRSEVLNQ